MTICNSNIRFHLAPLGLARARPLPRVVIPPPLALVTVPRPPPPRLRLEFGRDFDAEVVDFEGAREEVGRFETNDVSAVLAYQTKHQAISEGDISNMKVVSPSMSWWVLSVSRDRAIYPFSVRSS